MVLDQLRELLRRHLLAAGVAENQGVRRARAHFLAEFKQRRFVGQRNPFDFGVAGNALEVLSSECLDGSVFGFADPGDLEFHVQNSTIPKYRVPRMK